MSLLDSFIKFKTGQGKSKKLKQEKKDIKAKVSKDKQKKHQEADKKIKENNKEYCEFCNGTGIVEGTEDRNGKSLACTQCLGRGFIKKRKKLDLRPKKKDKREGKLIGKKKAKRIQTLFFTGLTIEEISSKVNIEEWIIKQVIQDMKDRLEQSLNKNN
jgi:hypothetical protein